MCVLFNIYSLSLIVIRDYVLRSIKVWKMQDYPLSDMFKSFEPTQKNQRTKKRMQRKN